MKGTRILIFSCFTILFSCITGIMGGGISYFILSKNPSLAQNVTNQDVKVVNETSAIIDVAEATKASVVSVIISKDLPVYENLTDPYGLFSTQKQTGTELQEIGAGTGFIISKDGMIITNRHVVSDEKASYTVIMNDDKKYDAKVLARDTLLDIAFIKIVDAVDAEASKSFTPIPLGDSSKLKVGQSVIAIGNALGEFSNTVSSGIISGLGRDIEAQDETGQVSEQLTDVIQTDASINKGNSGGPLLDIEGNVIGVNVAVAQDAQNIGFAIPINSIKDLMDRLNTDGSIDRPKLGVRYRVITDDLKKKNNLSVDYGALIVKGATADELAVIPGSPADKAGILENDIILQVDDTKLDKNNNLINVIQGYRINDEVTLKVLRKGSEIEIKVKLEKF